MRKSPPSIILLLVLLQGCASAPRVVMQAICPAIPPLDQPAAELEPDFTERMANFLQGKLPEQKPSPYDLPNAKLSTVQPVLPSSREAAPK